MSIKNNRKKESKMKKAFSLFLALVLCLSLCAFGSIGKQEASAEAPEQTAQQTNDSAPQDIGNITLSYKDKEPVTMTIEEYYNLSKDNSLKFKKLNEGATLTITGYVQKVSDTVYVNDTKFSNGYVYLTTKRSPWENKGFEFEGIYIQPLSKDELVELDVNSVVTLTGTFYGCINYTPVILAGSELEISADAQANSESEMTQEVETPAENTSGDSSGTGSIFNYFGMTTKKSSDDNTQNSELIQEAVEGMKQLNDSDMLLLISIINRMLG